MSDLSETDLLHRFIARVPYELPNVRVFRRNIIDGQLTTGQRVRNGIKGQSDAYAIVKGARHIEIEAKSLHGRFSPEQTAWRAFCERFEIPYLPLRACESGEQTITGWIDELRRVI